MYISFLSKQWDPFLSYNIFGLQSSEQNTLFKHGSTNWTLSLSGLLSVRPDNCKLKVNCSDRQRKPPQRALDGPVFVFQWATCPNRQTCLLVPRIRSTKLPFSFIPSAAIFGHSCNGEDQPPWVQVGIHVGNCPHGTSLDPSLGASQLICVSGQALISNCVSVQWVNLGWPCKLLQTLAPSRM